MRVSILLSLIRRCALVIIAVPTLAVSTASFAGEPGADPDAACRIPFETLTNSRTGEPFPQFAALNENLSLPQNIRERYIVADLNSADENGYCRGVQEYFAPVADLTEFPRLRAIAKARNVEITELAKGGLAELLESADTADDVVAISLELDDLRNYVAQVDKYKTEPVSKPPVFKGYCVGQTLSFCEIVDGKPKLVYRFVTSSSRFMPPLYKYYAPINYIDSRSWSSDRRYGPDDARRDARMGGGKSSWVPFANGGNPIEMPNFLHFLPVAGYVGEHGNGIHQIAGGLDSGGTFGSPVSLGCIRLNKYQSKLARWWTPRQAKFFVYFDPNRYRHFGDEATGKAKGLPVAAQTSTRVVEQTVDDNVTHRLRRSQSTGLFRWPWQVSPVN